MATASAVFQRFAQSPAPIAVFPPPHASSNTTALDVPEKQVLVRMYGVEQAFWMYLFLGHVTGLRFPISMTGKLRSTKRL